MSEITAPATSLPPAENPRVFGRQFVKGVSGNPNGRPKIEPRVRRYARKYDQRMCRVLASIAEDEKAPWSERRRAAMDLIAVGSGRPALVQEVAGRGGAPLGPLVNLNFGAQPGQSLSPEMAYRCMVEGTIPPDPSYFRKPAIEALPPEQPEKQQQP